VLTNLCTRYVWRGAARAREGYGQSWSRVSRRFRRYPTTPRVGRDRHTGPAARPCPGRRRVRRGGARCSRMPREVWGHGAHRVRQGRHQFLEAARGPAFARRGQGQSDTQVTPCRSTGRKLAARSAQRVCPFGRRHNVDVGMEISHRMFSLVIGRPRLGWHSRTGNESPWGKHSARGLTWADALLWAPSRRRSSSPARTHPHPAHYAPPPVTTDTPVSRARRSGPPGRPRPGGPSPGVWPAGR
jgi:hypothetical protein